jgi:LysM repeat protein
MSQYTVKQGDTLWNIAEKLLGNGNKYSEIQRENNLRSDVIHPDQVLKIPGRGHSTTNHRTTTHRTTTHGATNHDTTNYATTSHDSTLISVCSNV